ncbi:MAG TPA: hypothetical protein VFV94_18895 [Polyangiaceae bacterium]|nr:hypothetical protein [Polyangiaceae bacterium]
MATAPAGASVTFRSLDADGGMRVEGPGIAPNGGVCPRGCSLTLAPGNYTVHYSLHGKTTPLHVTISQSSDVVVSPPSSGQRVTAFSLIIVGGLAFTAGVATWYVDATAKRQERLHPDDPSYDYSSPDWLIPAYVVGAAGLGVGMLGAVLLFTASPSAEVTPKRAAVVPRSTTASNGSRFLFAPMVTREGGGLRAGFTF